MAAGARAGRRRRALWGQMNGVTLAIVGFRRHGWLIIIVVNKETAEGVIAATPRTTRERVKEGPL